MYVFFFLYLILFGRFIEASTEECAADVAEDFDATGLRYKCDITKVIEPSMVKTCCDYKAIRFAEKWQNGGNYLTTYLTTLKKWKCGQFKTECKNPTYAFNEFTELVYKRFCNITEYRSKCAAEIISNIINEGKMKPNGVITNENWTRLIAQFDAETLSSQNLQKPCLQVAMFDKVGVGRYFEVIHPHIPFHTLVWSGINVRTAQLFQISAWNYAPLWCKGTLIGCMVLMGLLALAIVVANGTVISVFIFQPKMRNSQYYYKLSLAIADFLVGCIVLPTCIYNQTHSLMTYRQHGEEITSLLFPNSTMNSEQGDDIINLTAGLQFRDGGSFSQITNQIYVRVVGFTSTTSLFVSVYTLVGASVDRFLAIIHPLRHTKRKAISMAKFLCCLLWVMAVGINLAPLFLRRYLSYGLVATFFVIPIGQSSEIFLALAFLLPIMLVWSLTFATFIAYKRHEITARRLNSSALDANMSVELRLAKTLTLMVGVFSVCVLPVLIMIIVQLSYKDIIFNMPCTLNIHSANLFTTAEYCFVILLLSNSLWNCFIYSARNDVFRKATVETYSIILTKMKYYVLKRATKSLIENIRKEQSGNFNVVENEMSVTKFTQTTPLNKRRSLENLADGDKVKEARRSRDTLFELLDTPGKTNKNQYELTMKHTENDKAYVTVVLENNNLTGFENNKFLNKTFKVDQV